MNTTSPASASLVSVRGLCIGRRFPRAQLIHDLSLDIAPGECFALIGESGSGKTLTALAIAGVLPRTMEITSGHIVTARTGEAALALAAAPSAAPSAALSGVLSAQASAMPSAQASAQAASGTAMVFQDARAALNPVRRIGRQFDDVLRAVGIARAHRRQQTREWLDQVAIADPDDCMRRYPFELSGGMCQRVLIALALARRPALLIADEPTSGLDPHTQATVLDLLFTLAREHGAGVLLITHDLHLAITRCARIGVLHNGTLCEIAAAQRFETDARHPYSRALIDATPTLQRVLQQRHLDALTQERSQPPTHARRHLASEALTQGQHPAPHHSADLARFQPTEFPQATPPQRAEPGLLLRVHGVSKRYASSMTPALDNVSFNIPSHRVTGIIGKSGSGKSTLAAAIARLVDIDQGNLVFDGVDIARVPLRHAASASWRRDIQLVFQDARGSLNPLASCRQAITAALQCYKGTPRYHNDAARLREDVDRMAEQLGLPLALLDRLPHQISGGEAARVGIARALINTPKLLILDEATVALDARVQADIINMLDVLRRRLNMTLLVISHDIALIRMLCDHVVVLEAGGVVEQGDCITVLDTPRHLATRQLLLRENASNT